MYVRCAYFMGTVAPENRARFNAFFDNESLPIMATFPNIRGVRILRGEWYEEGAPGIYQTIELTFDAKEDIDAMLKSEPRARNLKKLAEIMPLFEGKVFHINHRIDARR